VKNSLIFHLLIKKSVYYNRKVCFLSEDNMKNLYILTALLALSACVSKSRQPEYVTYAAAPQPVYGEYAATTVPTQIIYDYENYNPQNEVVTREIIAMDGATLSETMAPMEYTTQTTYVTSNAQPVYVQTAQPSVVYVEQMGVQPVAVPAPAPEIVAVESPLLPSQKSHLKDVKTVNHRRPRAPKQQNFYPQWRTVGGPAPMPQPVQGPVVHAPAPQPVNPPLAQPAGPEYLLK